jgi:gluconolactonase
MRGRTAVVVTVLTLSSVVGVVMAFAQEQRKTVSDEWSKIVPPDAKVEKLAGSMKFTEGPVWSSADGGFLVFSDIPSNELKKWSKKDGLSTFRKPSHNANGNTRDREGRLITCEHGSRTLTRTGQGGKVETLAERYDGKRLNSPNDAAVKSDGTIWFTDPPYGLEGRPAEQPGNFVYRLEPKTKDLKVVVKDMKWPNGICFSPDEKRLYVANSDGKNALINVFDVKDDGTLASGREFCRIDKGVPDGIRCDAAGRVWSSAGDGVHVFSPEGKLLGKIPVPESPANLCFGGEDGKTLFITARSSLYAVRTNVSGVTRP